MVEHPSHENQHPENLDGDSIQVHKHIQLVRETEKGPTICFRLTPKGPWKSVTSRDASILGQMLVDESEHEAKRRKV
jgi:hypothetical protein